MLIEVPSSYVDNILFFQKIYEICKNDKTAVLFINTSYSDIDYKKLSFLNSVLNNLLLDIKVIIDKEMPKHYENILFMSKLSKKTKVDLEDINISDIINDLNNRSIVRLNFKKFYFSTSFENYNVYENINITSDSIENIKQIITSDHNIKILFDILYTLEKNVDNSIYQNNYGLLKSKIKDSLNKIKILPMNNISATIKLNESINRDINFR